MKDFIHGKADKAALSVAQKEKILDQIREYLRAKSEVMFAWTHGSFVEERQFRDVDVAVYLNREGTLDEAIAWAVELERAIAYPVDVTFLNSAPLAFRFHVSQGVLLLCRDEDRKDSFLTQTWDAYFDFRPVAMRHLREVLYG